MFDNRNNDSFENLENNETDSSIFFEIVFSAEKMKIVNVPNKVFHSKMEKLALKFLSLNKKGVNNNPELLNDLNNNVEKSDPNELYNKETKKALC